MEEKIKKIQEIIKSIKSEWDSLNNKNGNTHIYWNIGKKKYQEEKNEEILTQLNNQRQRIINKVLPLIEEISGSNFISVGSKNITSDIDLTIYGGNIALFIYIFHNEFQKIFEYSSSEVYDINLYGEDFFKINYNKIFNTPINNNEKSTVYHMDNSNNETIKDDQHVWAFVHLLHTLPGKFKIKLNNILDNEEKDNEEKDNEEKYNKLKKIYNFAKKKADILNNIYNDNNISSLNLLYAKILFNLNDIYNSNNIDLKFKILCNNYLSLSCCFAEDAYITKGAIAHIVFIVQREFDYKMSRDEYFDSFIENIAKLFKSSKNDENKNDENKNDKNKNDCLYKIIDSSKYLFRLRLGFDEFYSNNNNLPIDEITKIKEIVQLRGEEISKNEEKINKYLKILISQKECSIDAYNKYVYKLLEAGIKQFFNINN